VVEDYDPDDDIRTLLTFNGTAYLNAWASDEDFDVAPRYVESFKGIKFASVYKRFSRSKQAYGHNYANYELSEEDGTTREIFVNATKYGPACIQPGLSDKVMKENCLYLNIWRPSKWKQSLNTTTICRQTFEGGGSFRKDCVVIRRTRTVHPDGTVTNDVDESTSSNTITLGGVYDKDGSVYDRDTDVLSNNDDFKIKDGDKKKEGGGNTNGNTNTNGRRTLLDLDDTLNDLTNALDDLNDVIEDQDQKKDNENGSSDGTTNSNDEEEEELSDGSTYSVDRTGLLPVMVYIHGGGFMHGSGNDPLFDGGKVAGRGQVILITLNYRLGVFGFLPTFGWDQWKVNGGMNGFMDIVNALIWIHRNIIKWGGNPNKITVFGPSSTPAVCLLTMCPLLVGKFQRAILTSSTRETEVRDGRLVTRNGVNGAFCLTSEQEPYQPLEGRIEIAYKFFDYVNETLYNYPQNPDPSRQDLIDWLSSLGQNSTQILQMARDEQSVFAEQRPAAEFDYNRDGNVTFTQQRRTFVTWDNDVFPRMPIDLEGINPLDVIVGVRGNRKQQLSTLLVAAGGGGNSGVDVGVGGTTSKNPNAQKRPVGGNNNNNNNIEDDTDEEITVSKQQNSDDSRDDRNDFIILRNLAETTPMDDENDTGNSTTSGGNATKFGDDDDDDNFYFSYDDDELLPVVENVTMCGNSTGDDDDASGNTTIVDGKFTTIGNETECQEEEEEKNTYYFDFSGTTSDQDLCVSKQFAEISARNVKGNVYAYVFDDGTELNGYRRDRRRKLSEEIEEFHRRMGFYDPRFQKRFGLDYDEESIYFFDNLHMGGSNFATAGGASTEFVRMRKELFNRWINFAKTGNPKYSSRNNMESKRYATWEPFPKGEVGRDTTDDPMPSYLYMPAERNDGKAQERSRLIPMNELMTHRTQKKYKKSGTDICSWVLDQDNDNDGLFVDVLLDFNDNTAFDYYVTVLATMNPTINYVADREYLAELPPTLSPTTIQQFIDGLSSSPPPPLHRGSKRVPFATLSVLIATVGTYLLAFG